MGMRECFGMGFLRKCRILLSEMPHFIRENATLRCLKCHTSSVLSCGILGVKLWHWGNWAVALGMPECDVSLSDIEGW